MHIVRIVLASVGIISVFTAPPWVPILCAVLLALRWRAPEVVLIGALIDLVWLSSTFLYGIPSATLGSILVLWILEPFRRELLVDPVVKFRQ